MRKLALFLVPALLALAVAATTPSTGAEPKGYPSMGTIERLDPAFDKLIGRDAVLEKLVDGHVWTEGPLWMPKDGGYVLFSDIPRNSIYKWQNGKESLFLKPSGYNGTRTDLKEPGSNGLLRDSEGRLILMQHGNRRVVRVEKDGKQTVLADRYEDKRFNSPNDGTFASNGDLYFTDPPYGLMVKGMEDSFPGRELDFCGVYRLSKDGKLTLLTKEMSRPNGIALSPDEKTLYVANSDPKQAIWKAFPVKEDGTLGAGKVFHDATAWVGEKRLGLPDGMKVDQAGNIFATGPGGVLVFTPQGKLLGVIATGVKTSNCGWGDDGSVLYVTADHALTRIKTKTKGKGF
jgi:gluconolactonase